MVIDDSPLGLGVFGVHPGCRVNLGLSYTGGTALNRHLERPAAPMGSALSQPSRFSQWPVRGGCSPSSRQYDWLKGSQ